MRTLVSARRRPSMEMVLSLALLTMILGAPALAEVPELPPRVPSPTPAPTPPESGKPDPDEPRPTKPPASSARAPSRRPPPPSSIELAVRATSGMGMYIWRWERTGTVDTVVQRARATGMNFLVVRASSQTQGFYLGHILGELLPKAHAAGLKVVAYDPPRFEDVEADVRRASELISFRAGGHGIDAFAADIEPRWELLTPDNAERYGARLREVAGTGFPLVGIVYPPNQVGARFPFAPVARHFDVLSPMSYWRAKTLDGPGFVAASVARLKEYGKPVSVLGQAFSYTGHAAPQLRGHPPRPEFDASIAAARAAGAVGMSFWVWEAAEPFVFDSIRDAAWPGEPGPGAGIVPAPVRPYAPPGAPVPTAPPPDPVTTPAVTQLRAQALASRAAGGERGGSGLALALAVILLGASMLGAVRTWWPEGIPAADARAIMRAIVDAAERGCAPWIQARGPTKSRRGSSRSGRA